MLSSVSASLLERARLLSQQGHAAQAEQVLHEALRHDPRNINVCQGLSALSEARGDLELAVSWQKRALEIQASGGSCYNLARLLARQGNVDAAIAQYRRALEFEPGLVQAYNNLGNLFLREGRTAQAIEVYRHGLALAPTHADLPYNLGLALQKSGQENEAREMFLRALRQSPGAADVMLALGTLAHEAGAPDDAARWYRKACQAAPDFIEAHFNLGKALHDLNRPDEAIEAYRHALSLNPTVRGMASQTPAPLHPRLAQAHYNLGRVLLRQGRIDEWIEHFHAWKIQGEDLLNVQYALEVANAEGRFKDAESSLAYLVEHAQRYEDVDQMSHLLSMAQWMLIDQAALFRLYHRFDELARAAIGGKCLTPKCLSTISRPDGDRRSRIGYLSPDFNEHVMGRLMHEVIARHDKDRFQVFLYSLRDKEDTLSRRFREIAHSYVPVGALSPRQAAERIASDELDLLVDLAGHTSGSRPLILAYKPAPVQLTHLGYHGALGLSAVDYKITDAYADLPENAAYMVEKLLPMPGCLMPFQHQEPASFGMSRDEAGLGDARVVFGVFVGYNKLSESCLRGWRAILEATEGGVLAFSPLKDWQGKLILKRTAAAGIASERVVFIPSSSDPAVNRARYGLVDIVLDTFPYSGGDTTMAALDMAVPVVTLCGSRQCERVTYSILKNLGVEDGITHSEDEYVSAAVRLAGDAHARQRMSAEIRARMADSVLTDMDGYVRNLEATYLLATAGTGAA